MTGIGDGVTEIVYPTEALLRWKEEATQILRDWEAVFVALGKPGDLGDSKAFASQLEVVRLQRERNAYRKALEALAEETGDEPYSEAYAQQILDKYPNKETS